MRGGENGVDAWGVESPVERQHRFIECALGVGLAVCVGIGDDEANVGLVGASAIARSRSAAPAALFTPRSKRLEPRNRLPKTPSGWTPRSRFEQMDRLDVLEEPTSARSSRP